MRPPARVDIVPGERVADMLMGKRAATDTISPFHGRKKNKEEPVLFVGPRRELTKQALYATPLIGLLMRPRARARGPLTDFEDDLGR